MKKIILAFLLVCALFIVGCSTDVPTESGAVDNLGEEVIESVGSGSSVDDIDDSPLSEMSEKERYAEFEATIACDLAVAGMNEDQDAIMDVMGSVESYAERFDFTEEEMVSLIDEYGNDSEFISIVEGRMQEMCPEAYAAMQEE